ncbi:MAG: phenylalanine--tRNA ligase subunit alpha [Candidatus Baltobacteraceae bacterium]
MSALQPQLDEIARRLRAAADAAHDGAALEELRVRFLGRSGEVTLVRRGIGALPSAERPDAGKTINDAVTQMEAMLDEASTRIARGALDEELRRRIDVTFPAPDTSLGSIHPVRRIIEEIAETFKQLGFATVLGAEVEPSYYTFDALNIPADHPAREGFDSFFITPELLLRPHTSPMQIRTMQQHRPPVAILAPGRCYRRDAVDARHLFQFHQVEGLLVAEGINFGHLKGALAHLSRTLFGADQRVRFRPSFFPFTEPSAEVDTTCPKCKGSGESCSMCGGSGWIEIGGAGMVHPNVLREVGYDPAEVSGWAFGVGVERIALARYEIDDIRRLIECDTDFLRQLQ